MAETRFDDWIARHYRTLWPDLFEHPLLDAALGFLTELTRPGRALEFGIGTGRVALPLERAGVPVHGIELSLAMVEELRRQEDGSEINVTVGDFATTIVGGTFRVVYLLRNTITNLTTQGEQVECFKNAARPLGAWRLLRDRELHPRAAAAPAG